MNHYLYRIDRPTTGEFYIGLRSTTNGITEDPYMGSGTLLWKKMKDRRSEFMKTILVQVESREEVERLEAGLVTAELVADPLCLNLQPGGYAGAAGIPRTAEVVWAIADANHRRLDSDEHKRRKSESAKRWWAAKKLEDPSYGTGSNATGETRDVHRERLLCERTTKILDRWMTSKYRHRVLPTEAVDPFLHFGKEND
jgi:hypothetical protein